MDESDDATTDSTRTGNHSEEAPESLRGAGAPQKPEIAGGYVERAKYLGRHFICSPLRITVGWLDRHDGLLTALATGAIAVLTLSLAHDSARQAKISNRQLEAMQGQLDAMKSDQRPWIGLLGIDPLQDANAVMVKIVNGGKSPALNVRASILGGQIGTDTIQFPGKPCGSDCTLAGIEMLPNVPLGRRIPPLNQVPVAASAKIWVVVRVDYSDTDGGRHTTGVCLIRIPPYGDMQSCPGPYSNYAN